MTDAGWSFQGPLTLSLTRKRGEGTRLTRQDNVVNGCFEAATRTLPLPAGGERAGVRGKPLPLTERGGELI